jgi:hypothetical protein
MWSFLQHQTVVILITHVYSDAPTDTRVYKNLGDEKGEYISVLHLPLYVTER